MAREHTQIDEVEERHTSEGEQLPEATQHDEVARDAGIGDDGQEEEEPDTYVIEDICGHKMRRKGLYFWVKWEGWTRKNWEPESNLREGAAEMLDDYIDANGGREAIEKEAREAALAKKQATKPWQPPPGLWDDEIEEIRLREEDGRRIGYCWWQNGEAARFPVELLHKRAPQTMLKLYEGAMLQALRVHREARSQAT